MNTHGTASSQHETISTGLRIIIYHQAQLPRHASGHVGRAVGKKHKGDGESGIIMEVRQRLRLTRSTDGAHAAGNLNGQRWLSRAAIGWKREGRPGRATLARVLENEPEAVASRQRPSGVARLPTARRSVASATFACTHATPFGSAVSCALLHRRISSPARAASVRPHVPEPSDSVSPHVGHPSISRYLSSKRHVDALIRALPTFLTFPTLPTGSTGHTYYASSA